jgi:hypothetical protein
MKKIATVIFAVLSAGYVAQASAAAATSPIIAADPSVTGTVSSTECPMVAQTSTFNLTPSRNVGLAYTCSTTAIAVNSGNKKGKYTYGGSSNGGSVTQCGGATPVAVDTTNGYTVAAPDSTKDGCS